MGVPSLDKGRKEILAKYDIKIEEIEPMGARVEGLDLKTQEPPKEVLDTLQNEMAERGFIVFGGQGVMSGDQQVFASKLWGAREMHSTHGVHPMAPNPHIFRLSNDSIVGINGVGPQWHNDGSFCLDCFSHVGYHIIKVPKNGGNTIFSHQGAAYDALPKEMQDEWSKYVSVNSNSGVLHPMVHEHWISGRKSIWLHLGMTGAVIRVDRDKNELRLLDESEMTKLMIDYNDLLNAGLPENDGNFSISYPYQEGDCIFIDNLAISHRASPEAHAVAKKQGLRILHRTTIKSPIDFSPPKEWGLPNHVNILGPNPFGKGVWQGGGIGFRWDDEIRM